MISKPVIACMLWGSWGNNWAGEYVVRLYNMIRKNITVPFDFVCFNDKFNATGEIQYIKMPDFVTEELSLNLPKFYIHSYLDEFIGRRIFLFDLDTIIVNNIDDLLSYDGYFCGIEPFAPKNKNKYLAGGMMSFISGTTTWFWDMVIDDPEYWAENSNGGKERMILPELENQSDEVFDRWQRLYPGKLVSYKRHCKKNDRIPKGASIIAFHGLPRPHQVRNLTIVRKYWR